MMRASLNIAFKLIQNEAKIKNGKNQNKKITLVQKIGRKSSDMYMT